MSLWQVMGTPWPSVATLPEQTGSVVSWRWLGCAQGTVVPGSITPQRCCLEEPVPRDVAAG